MGALAAVCARLPRRAAAQSAASSESLASPDVVQALAFRAVEAARDAGASRFDIVRFIVLPLCKTGIALGSIFVVSIVMGDFFVVKVMSGGGSASVVGAFYEDIGVLQYPTAAASATVLTIIMLLLVVMILRTVDIRKELTR